MQQGHRPGPPGQRLGSFYNDLEKLLLEQKIESISLNPDTVVETWLFLAGNAIK